MELKVSISLTVLQPQHTLQVLLVSSSPTRAAPEIWITRWALTCAPPNTATSSWPIRVVSQRGSTCGIFGQVVTMKLKPPSMR